jgi:putative ABC transport system ATP-binding protein
MLPAGGTAPSRPLIRAEHLARTYQVGEQLVPALRAADFSIMPGEFVAIMGPSGSGKSTLMNLIGALDQPTGGRLEIDGADLGALDRDELATLRNRTIGFVFQQFNLLPRTSALDNVRLPLVYARPRPADPEGLARARLVQVGLGERMHHQPSQLSGGQQQRVAIARALVNQPRLILADEPTGALDTQTSADIMALFRELNSQGLTIVLVTHEPDVAAHARRLLRMRDGRIIEDRAVGAGGV